MATYLATVDVHDGHGGVHWYGVIYEPPIITRSIGSGDAVTGFVEYTDCEWEMFPREPSSAIGDFTYAWMRDDLQGLVVQVQFRDASIGLSTIEWTGTIQEDSLLANGGVRLRGTAFPYEALTQRLPWPVITLTDWPNAVDVGKTPPYIIGTVKKLKLLYVNDGGGGTYDYLLMLGVSPNSYPNLFRDTLNQGATLPSGVQSFEAIPPGDFTVIGSVSAASGYVCVIIRFTTRQVNANGALVGIFADFMGDGTAFSTPIEAIRCVLTHNTDGLYGPGDGVDAASFEAANAKFSSLIAPRLVRIDGILGINNQSVAVGDILRPLLKACNGYLGINAAGKFTMNIDGPPTEYKASLGAGPTVAVNNLVEPGTRRRTALGDRPKRFILDYSYDVTTGAYQFQRVKTVEGTKGRDITTAIPYLVRHDSADIVADRLARIQRNSQDVIEGTVAPWDYSRLNEGDVFLYTWAPHGCEDEPRKIIRIRKELRGVTIDHRKYADEWGYEPTALPPAYENPENNPPTAPPPVGTSGLVEDTGEQRIITGQMTATSTYQTMITIGITVDAAGRTLKKWGFVEITSSAEVIGGSAGTAWVRLRNVSTGALVEITKTLSPNAWLFPGQTVFLASFSAAELQQNETAGAGTHTIVLELKTSPSQILYYGSADTLLVGSVSNGYLRAQEWTP